MSFVLIQQFKHQQLYSVTGFTRPMSGPALLRRLYDGRVTIRGTFLPLSDLKPGKVSTGFIRRGRVESMPEIRCVRWVK